MDKHLIIIIKKELYVLDTSACSLPQWKINLLNPIGGPEKFMSRNFTIKPQYFIE